jgi:ABC-type uncharacterized transport system substrate-binding protein
LLLADEQIFADIFFKNFFKNLTEKINQKVKISKELRKISVAVVKLKLHI